MTYNPQWKAALDALPKPEPKTCIYCHKPATYPKEIQARRGTYHKECLKQRRHDLQKERS